MGSRRTWAEELNIMNGKKLQQIAAEWGVPKVRGKVFMLTTDVTGEPLVILKSAPDEAAALREQHAEITPGYHMDKRHWITLHGGDSLDRGLVEELVTDSYRLMVAGLPKAQRPVDPATYAQAVQAPR
ncbi:hypothetical protein IQ63_08910 [Streptomyces acidiscabies]|uniref:Cytoplasmic protein n=2 Tax=Streptomyces acidiscabies TaxID=42234 RepID=A0A0L0KJ14_9ACTN|nr:hypothetical protein IQ63_08910 [Streptomyces acidiscabies]